MSLQDGGKINVDEMKGEMYVFRFACSCGVYVAYSDSGSSSNSSLALVILILRYIDKRGKRGGSPLGCNRSVVGRRLYYVAHTKTTL
jgi:glutamate synthase domain-containing protein 1